MDNYLDEIFKNIDDSIILDQEQRDVILDDSNFLMVIAGAGSGKTTTMAAKVKYLVDIKKINPKEIVMISFTNKAIDELKFRLYNQFHIHCHISTFHSLAFSILRKNGYNLKVEPFPHKIVENFLNQNKKCQKVLKNPQYCVELIGLYKINPAVFHHKNRFNNCFNKLFNYYTTYMEKNHLIDFEDMINKCYKMFEKRQIEFNYKYIIIDEFQDISWNKYLLIKQISKHSSSKVIVVGDDWQSIFSFAGSKVDLFFDFSKKSKILKITHTYRNSQQLINIAGNFIMRNTRQIGKQLKSNKYLANPITLVCYRKAINTLKKVIEKLVLEYGTKQQILILGRYSFDINDYIDNDELKYIGNRVVYFKYPNLDITYLTVHASKGLGYDNVIILNVNKGIYGFPSLKRIDKYKQQFMNDTDFFLFAEERRLFYVALTRTKNKVYILYKIFNGSIFIKELKHYHGVNTKIYI